MGFYTYQPILKNIDISDNSTEIAYKVHPKIFYSTGNHCSENHPFSEFKKLWFAQLCL